MSKLKEMVQQAEANGMMVGVSPTLQRVMEDLEARAEPFIEKILAGEEKLDDVTTWLRSGRSKSLSSWQCEEMASYIESAVAAVTK